jgi:hypothetical protein
VLDQMAKRKQHAKKQHNTLKKQKSKKLSKIAKKLIDHFDNVDLLRKVGEKSDNDRLIESLTDIFDDTEEITKDTFSSSLEIILEKLKTLKQLILLNISNTAGKKNFCTQELREDRMFVTDIVFKIQSSSTVDNKDLKIMNNLYKKHKRIKQLFD